MGFHRIFQFFFWNDLKFLYFRMVIDSLASVIARRYINAFAKTKKAERSD